MGNGDQIGIISETLAGGSARFRQGKVQDDAKPQTAGGKNTLQFQPAESLIRRTLDAFSCRLLAPATLQKFALPQKKAGGAK